MSSIESVIASQTAIQQAQTRTQIAYTVAGKTLDVQRQQGEAATQLVEAAAQLGKALGKGTHFDRQG